MEHGFGLNYNELGDFLCFAAVALFIQREEWEVEGDCRFRHKLLRNKIIVK